MSVGLRLHERTLHVQGAEASIQLATIDLQAEHELTDVEMIRALLHCMQSISTRLLRVERHPDNPDQKADEE